MRITEVFGPTVQGEGRWTGRRCAFVRTAGCNLACEWCDTPYSWDWTGLTGPAYDRATETTTTTVDAVATEVLAMRVDRCVITGGEPFLQASNIANLARNLTAVDIAVAVETNGTRPPGPLPDDTLVTVSPKLTSSGQLHTVNPLPAGRLEAWAQRPNTDWKLVAATPTDVEEAHALITRLAIPPAHVWIMPLGATADTVRHSLRNIADLTIHLGYNLSPRLHIDIWEDERGH